jgi:tetratricopeptide (TPR) repeat protein
LIQELGEAVACRETEHTSVLLASWDDRTVLMSPAQKNAALLLSSYAQWIDFDSIYLPRVEELLKKFRGQTLQSPLEIAHFNLSEGLVQFHHENYDDAIIYFNTAKSTADDLRDDDLMVMSRYYLARCFWKKGQYNTASQYADRAIQLSGGTNRQKRVAAIKMVKGWLCFLKGEFLNARELLKEAQIELEATDPINHGNVLSFYGRLDIKEGQYESAMRHFEKAIEAYLVSDRKHPHPNIARTHTNMAIACYDQARQLPATPESREQLLALRQSAIEHLDAAQHIYERNPQTHNRGLGKVHYLRALLYASVGELDRAQAEVESAYQLGEGKGDHVLMGRAKRIEYKITTDRVDRLAVSEQTLVHAKQTDNRTLLARAYLNLASVLRSGGRTDEADKYVAEAEKWLMPAERNNRYWEEEITKAQETGNRSLLVQSEGT